MTLSPAQIDHAEIDALVDGVHTAPHQVLGPHVDEESGAVTVRVLRPNASVVELVIGEHRQDMEHVHRGVWATAVAGPEIPDYRLAVTYEGDPVPGDDPYRFLPTIGEVDQHLIAEGRHEQLWQVMGAHTHVYETVHGPVHGVSFAVWAPSAKGVRVVGDFNFWDGTATPMRSLGSTGIWEIFIPEIGDGSRYKFDVLGHDGVRRLKADPYANATEVPPETASVVFTSQHDWDDEAWMDKRAKSDPHTGPMSTYEVHLASWRPGLSWDQLAVELTEYVVTNGFTHVEFLPVMEHPFGGSWGYQVTSYYAPTARLGDPDGLRRLIQAMHNNDISVIVDWVPAHFPKDEFALARFDGTPLFEHPDPSRGEQPDWGTYVFDFGRPEVRNFLVANAIYWCEEYHVDGLRVDAVASMLYLDYSRKKGEWTPNAFGGRENLEAVEFIQEMNATLYKRVPGVVTIAEESTSWPGVTRPTHLGGLGFGLKWNMGWMNDSLAYLAQEPVHRQFHHGSMTFALMYAWSENFVLPISHDEVVHGKGSLLRKVKGDRWQQLATVRAFLAYMWAHPGKQLLFMGQEFAQDAEWSEERGLDWWLLDHPEHKGVQAMIRDANHIYQDNPPLWARDHEPEGFEWIDANDASNNTFSWLRWDGHGNAVACIVNFSAIPHHNYRIGLPFVGEWEEILNTDSEIYGGSGVGNLGIVHAREEGWHARPASADISVPPLGAVWLRLKKG